MEKSRKTGRVVVSAAALLAAVSLGAPEALAADAGPGTGGSVSAHGTVGPLGRLGPLTDLVIQRLLVSDQVAASKFGTDSPIDDPAREQQEIDAVRQRAPALGLDPDATAAFFQDQITASKTVQKGLFARWRARPDEAPATRPDLGPIRDRLDRITTELLHRLSVTRQLRRTRVGCTVQLALATRSGSVVDRLDALHRGALATATRSVCTG